jgi:HEAT repeat protein
LKPLMNADKRRFRSRPFRTGAVLLMLLPAACATSGGGGEGTGDVPRTRLSDEEVSRIKSWTEKAARHFPTYVEALCKFGSPRAEDWADGERMLELYEKLMEVPVDVDLRKALHAGDPKIREMARKALARRGEIYRLWLELHPKEDELTAATDEARASARRARYIRWIKAREAMIAIGEDAAALYIEAFLQMLPRSSPDEQLIIRDELKDCGPRVIPFLTTILDIPPREGSLPIRQQCLLVLAHFADQPEAVTALQRYSKSEHTPTRRGVAEALRNAWQRRRADAPRAILEPMLRNDPAWDVRAAAAQALGDIGHPAAGPALLDAVENCDLPKPEDRTSFLKFGVAALGQLRVEDAVGPLIRLLEENPNPDLRRNAMLALNKITGHYFATPAGWRQWLLGSSPAPK